MKRRESARPVVVEIKRTRAPLSASSNSSRLLTPSNPLWRGTPLHEATAEISREQRQPLEVDGKAAASSSQPIRRILPSLTPMYVPSEPEQEKQFEGRKLLRAARAKPAKIVPESPAVLSSLEAPAVSRSEVTSQGALGLLAETSPSCSEPPRELSPTKRATLSKKVGREHGDRDQSLRRGEFWKRRLPKVCW